MAIHPCGAESVLIALLSSLAILGPTLTRPGFTNFQVLFAGWIQTTGLHAVTETLVATDVARRRHHERFHRFFSRGSWAPDQWGKILFFAALCLVPEGAAIGLVIDDTLAPKKGAEVFGIGSHLDAVRSTRTRRVFAFGHCWVMLAILVPVPFSERRWALPVLFRLYRNKKTVAKERPSNHKKPYRKKTELGREMLDLAIGWAEGRRIELSADSAYCNDTVAQDLPESVVLLGAMRPDAVLTAPATARVGKQRSGRPRKRGETLPKPQALANNPSTPWQHLEILLYGQSCTLLFKECVAQWYRPCGTRLLRIIIVHVQRGSIGLRVFFSTDSKMSPLTFYEATPTAGRSKCASATSSNSWASPTPPRARRTQSNVLRRLSGTATRSWSFGLFSPRTPARPPSSQPAPGTPTSAAFPLPTFYAPHSASCLPLTFLIRAGISITCENPRPTLIHPRSTPSNMPYKRRNMSQRLTPVLMWLPCGREPRRGAMYSCSTAPRTLLAMPRRPTSR